MAKIVTPFMGVWIEITNIYTRVSVDDVTPFMGVWIEMMHKNRETSLGQVTPFMGVWIEIGKINKNQFYNSHSLYGSVD